MRASGISALGIAIPKQAMHVKDLAKKYGVDPDKYTVGLGCQYMALCVDETVVDLAVKAAQRALKAWGGDPSQIGLIAVGTESSLDEARPLSAFVMERLGLSGAMRSYEVKHACHGGTLALRQALEWQWAGIAQPGQVALVIAADVCQYEPGHPAEATQGAGAVAMVVGEPTLCAIDPVSYPYTQPIWDFWRPSGAPHPIVRGQTSMQAYCVALEKCWASALPIDYDALCLHVPFPKMVTKAVRIALQKQGIEEDVITQFLDTKVQPYMEWNRQIGNAYTASLWISVAQALSACPPNARIGAFSFGSGCGAELLTLRKSSTTHYPWVEEVINDLVNRIILTN